MTQEERQTRLSDEPENPVSINPNDIQSGKILIKLSHLRRASSVCVTRGITVLWSLYIVNVKLEKLPRPGKGPPTVVL
jgi:hypothetical protein